MQSPQSLDGASPVGGQPTHLGEQGWEELLGQVFPNRSRQVRPGRDLITQTIKNVPGNLVGSESGQTE